MEVFNPNSNINFLGWRKVSMTVSAVLVAIALAAILFKGSGFYQTDYRSSSYTEGAKKDAPATEPAKPAEKPAAESKPASPKPEAGAKSPAPTEKRGKGSRARPD